jgi:RNA polymerase sigma factor (TIGR02999 family)
MSKTGRVTKLLQKVQEGSNEAYDELFPLIYKELKRLAYSKLNQGWDNMTLSETALVHEVYIKIADQDSLTAKNKSHFMAIAARCMRQILIDHARKKKREKRGGNQRDITFIDELMEVHYQAEELIGIDAKLKELARIDERLAKVVELRFFGKLPIYQVAQVLDISKSTVKRDWDKARGWLYKELKG